MGAVFTPGDETFYASDSPTSSFSGVFEDDGQTGDSFPFAAHGNQHDYLSV